MSKTKPNRQIKHPATDLAKLAKVGAHNAREREARALREAEMENVTGGVAGGAELGNCDLGYT